jgi:hypothetical protein
MLNVFIELLEFYMKRYCFLTQINEIEKSEKYPYMIIQIK